MTTSPVDEHDLDEEQDPFYLSPDEIEALSEEDFQLYLQILKAEAEGIGVPLEGSPGALAEELTGGLELHPAHLKLVDDAYMKLDTGEIDRLLITMGPQHGKSSRSRWGSLHRLKNHPEQRIVVASAELTLARTHTRWVRNLIEKDAREQRRLGLDTAKDHRAASDWDLSDGRRGGMYAVGIGGALTGRPADLLVLDDPVKDAKKVERPEQRQAMWEWWTQVAMTRLSPRASVVVIMTRWHEDDIAGRILKAPDADRWHVLHLPTVCDDPESDLLGRELGEPLWPGRYDRDWLDKQRVLLGSRAFAALYQGRPVPAGGTLLKKEWFKVRPDWPRAGRPLRYWDLAATSAEQGSDPDWTVGALVCLHQGVWYVVDVARFQESPHGLKRRLEVVRDADGPQIPVRAEQEPGSSGKIAVYDLATTVFTGYDFRARTSTGSKVLRANPLAAAAEAGNVVLIDGPWVKAFLDEAESFPFGSHDDQVDAVAGAMAWLAGPVETRRVVQQTRWGHLPARR